MQVTFGARTSKSSVEEALRASRFNLKGLPRLCHGGFESSACDALTNLHNGTVRALSNNGLLPKGVKLVDLLA